MVEYPTLAADRSIVVIGGNTREPKCVASSASTVSNGKEKAKRSKDIKVIARRATCELRRAFRSHDIIYGASISETCTYAAREIHRLGIHRTQPCSPTVPTERAERHWFSLYLNGGTPRILPRSLMHLSVHARLTLRLFTRSLGLHDL